MVIAIDGPASTGKTTISKLLAEDLNFVRIDTGAMYRCVTYEMQKKGVSLENLIEIENILATIHVEFGNNGQTVFLNGEDVTNTIRSKEVTEWVSLVSVIKEVRYKLVEMQRKLAASKNVVMEGRDIGTYVFPNAELKIYLDASLEERIKRRYEENQQKGIKMSFEDIKENIIKRDEIDKLKELGALKIAEDAIVIDTSNLALEQVKERIKEKYYEGNY